MIALSALAPVFFSIAFLAIVLRAPSVNSSFTSSSSSNFWYCLIIAFFGSVRIFTSMSSVNPSKVNTIVRYNASVVSSNFLKSSDVTFFIILGSLSYLSVNSLWKPMAACLLSLSLIMSSKSGKAPPQINKIFFVLTVASGTIAFLLVAPTGTSTSLPSKSLSIPCWTDSPLTSLLLVFCFFAILSISSIKIIPVSALSTSLSAAAKSFETTLSISSPIYPASVSDVASVIARGTSNNLAKVLTRYVLPEPVGPIINIFDFSISISSIVFVATLL